MRSLHHRVEVLEAKMAMVRDEGDSPPGKQPQAEYVEALEATEPGERDRIKEVRKAHREGRGPPSWAGGSE